MIYSKATKMYNRFLDRWQKKFKAHNFDIRKDPERSRRAHKPDDCVRSIFIDGEYSGLGIRPLDTLEHDTTEEEYFAMITQRIEESLPEYSYKLSIGEGAMPL